MKTLVDRFLSWPLPHSVAADQCATSPGPGRYGSSLLNAVEAEQMVKHLLQEGMTEAIETLDGLPSDDPEVAHGQAEQVLLDYLCANGACELADAFKRARGRIGFWYA